MTRIKFYLFLFATLVCLTGCSSSLQLPDKKTNAPDWINLDTIQAGKFDTGKMWTFEYPPVDYFKEEYNFAPRSEEHTSELQSLRHLVCRLLLEKKKKI